MHGQNRELGWGRQTQRIECKAFFRRHRQSIDSPPISQTGSRRAEDDPYRSSPEPMAMADVGGKAVNWMLRQEGPPSFLRWIYAEFSIDRVFQNRQSARFSVNEKPRCLNAIISDPR